MKLFFSAILWIVISNVSAENPSEYVIVGVSGYATHEDGLEEPSGVHSNLVTNHASIFKSYKLVHYSKKKDIEIVLDNFKCRKRVQHRKDLGLIIMANSWGAKFAHKLSKAYKKKCGRKTDFYFLIDGVAKPAGPFLWKPIANKCFNYYQTKGVIRGKKMRNCKNMNYTKLCKSKNHGAVDCHISVEWWGSKKAYQTLIYEIL